MQVPVNRYFYTLSLLTRRSYSPTPQLCCHRLRSKYSSFMYVRVMLSQFLLFTTRALYLFNRRTFQLIHFQYLDGMNITWTVRWKDNGWELDTHTSDGGLLSTEMSTTRCMRNAWWSRWPRATKLLESKWKQADRPKWEQQFPVLNYLNSRTLRDTATFVTMFL